ncbi:MAG: hypothetical protein AAFY71_09375 [Bacteroidota bacterium]
MKGLTIFMFLILLFAILPAYSQDPEYLRSQLKQFFNEAKNGLPSESTWIALNMDSSYYKQPVIQLFRQSDPVHTLKEGDSFVEWKFYNPSTFRLLNKKRGYKKSTHSSGKENMYRIKLQLIDRQVFVTLKNMNGEKETFLVVDLEGQNVSKSLNQYPVLTLLRV